MKLEQQIFELERLVADGAVEPYLLPHVLRSLLRLRQIDAPGAATGSSTLYVDAVEAYDQWHKATTGVKMRFSASEGKAVKEILKYLRDNQDGTDDETVLYTWRFILDKWPVLNDFLRSQTKLVQINKNLIEIIAKIKRHASTDKAGPQRGADIADIIAASRSTTP